MLSLHILYCIPKKTVFSILIAVVLIQAFVTSYFYIYRPIVDVQQVSNQFLVPSPFHHKAASYLSQISEDTKRFWLLDSGLQHLDVELPLSSVLASEESNGPDKIVYDPRYTISAYMGELGRIGNTPNLPTLPFHWVDWVDATFQDTQIGRPEQPPVTCDVLKRQMPTRPDTTPFCRDRDDYSVEELEILGYKNRNQLPKAVITGHCSHRIPGSNAGRVFMAKSYAMSHMPKPLKVVILNGGETGGSYDFMVDQSQSPDQRLLYSKIGANFVHSADAVLKDEKVQFNPQDVLANLRSQVPPRILSADADVMSMHRTVRGPPGSPKDLALSEEHFNYPSNRIQEQISELEQMEVKDAFQQNYLDGLKQCSLYDNSKEPVYFKMAILDYRERRNTRNEGGWHYDWRFFNGALYYDKEGWTKDERSERNHIILERLSRNWNRFAEEKGIVSWIMHGPLLAWYWDGLIFPYDNDIDIQMPISELVRLAKDYNQTLVVESPEEGYGRYLIDVGTYIHNRDRSKTGNHIDARFIDVDSGIYIDITGLAKSSFNLPSIYKSSRIVEKADGDSDAEVYNDRRKHFYTLPQISPLRYSMMDGIPVFIPHGITDRLAWEYRVGLKSYEHRGWYFVPQLQLWLVKDKLLQIYDEAEFRDDENKFSAQKLAAKVKQMSDDDALRLLQDEAILREYYLTSKFTDWHKHEKSFLFTESGEDNSSALEDPEIRQQYNNLVAGVKFTPPLRKALFEYQAFDRLNHRKETTPPKKETIRQILGN